MSEYSDFIKANRRVVLQAWTMWRNKKQKAAIEHLDKYICSLTDEVRKIRRSFEKYEMLLDDFRWRDISSAPDDGNELLLGNPEWSTSVAAKWDNGKWVLTYTGDALPDGFNPTHWTRLPIVHPSTAHGRSEADAPA